MGLRKGNVCAAGRRCVAKEQQKKSKKNRRMTVFPFSRSTRSQQATEYQAQIERADVNQQSLENVLVPAQMRPSHSTGIVAMREAPLVT